MSPISPRIFMAGVFQETSDFSPIPTSMSSFDAQFWDPETDAVIPGNIDILGYRGALRIAEQAGAIVLRGPFASAVPAARMSAATWRALKDRILDPLRRAAPVDGVFLMLHGAMMAQGVDDCEGDLTSEIRHIVGPDAVIAAAFDLHGNISARMLEDVDIPVACKEYPHIDFEAAGAQATAIMLAALAGRTQPVVSASRVALTAIAPTTGGVIQAFVAKLRDAETRPGILSVSAFFGFFGADQEDMGAMLVVISNADPSLGDTVALELSTEMMDAVQSLGVIGRNIETALDEAEAHDGRVIIADRADNAGGGAASDSTFLLRAILDRSLDHVAAGLFWDPVAVDLCHSAGIGAKFPLRFGGKIGPMSGQPIDLDIEVTAVKEGVRQAWFGKGPPTLSIGRSAAVRFRNTDIILNSERHQVFSRHAFEDHGIRLEDKRVIVVKSTAHFHQAFAPLGRVIYCDAPGTLSMNFKTLPYRRIRRPIWPIDDVPASSSLIRLGKT